MNERKQNKSDSRSGELVPVMQERQIAMPDGRYMIFFTFGELVNDSGREENAVKGVEPNV